MAEPDDAPANLGIRLWMGRFAPVRDSPLKSDTRAGRTGDYPIPRCAISWLLSMTYGPAPLTGRGRAVSIATKGPAECYSGFLERLLLVLTQPRWSEKLLQEHLSGMSRCAVGRNPDHWTSSLVIDDLDRFRSRIGERRFKANHVGNCADSLDTRFRSVAGFSGGGPVNGVDQYGDDPPRHSVAPPAAAPSSVCPRPR
jgi:hypothetical protein